MPPRRSDQLEAAAAPACDPFAALPHALLLALFALLPVDQRMRCAEVCRGWRALLSDASLWLRLDLSPVGGVARDAATNVLLRAAAARAAGGLQALDLTGCSRIWLDTIRLVAAENSSALVELRMVALLDNTTGWWPRDSTEFEQLLRAAPQLRVLEVDVRCAGVEEARCLLRNEAPFGPLRVRKLRIMYRLADADAVRSLTEELPLHEWLSGLELNHAPLNLPAALDAVVDTVLQLRLSFLELYECRLTPASAPALARLLRGNALRTLSVNGDAEALFDEPAALLLGNALRANTTLTSLTFNFINLFDEPASAAALLGALAGHPSLHKLDVSDNNAFILAPPILADAGAALAALVAANAPALQELHLRRCWLAVAGLGTLVDALAHNTHLRRLDCRDNALSEAFKHDRLLPAVRANAWLQVHFGDEEE
jgi:hypothetical protein